MRVIVGIEHSGGDNTWGGGSHEALGELLRSVVRTAEKEGTLLLHRAQILIADLGNCLRGVEDLGSHHAPRLQHPGKIRELTQVLRSRPLALAAKPAHALRHIGLKTDPGLLAVVANIDPSLKLLLHNMLDRQFRLPLQFG